MNLELSGKTALVTGSTAGIGYAIAERLLKEGASVIVNGRTHERVDAAVRRLGLAKGFVGDLSREADRKRLIEQFPQVEILINNLGIYESRSLNDIQEGDWNRLFDINVVSGARLSQFYLEGMRARNWGRIVFIASETGVNIPEDMIHYGVSKAAQIALARGLAETTKGTGITVNSVLPGPTLSEGVTNYLAAALKESKADADDLKKEFIQSMRPTSLLQRFATSEEVANLVTYISSPLASATNGASLRVEGGLLRNV